MSTTETQEESMLYNAFVRGFMETVGPQLCHQLLTPATIFVPQGNEPLMKEIFYACGASFLAKKFPEFQQIASSRYQIALALFATSLSCGGVGDWMAGAALLFCLRDKMMGTSPLEVARHLHQAIHLMRSLRRGGETITLKFLIESFLYNYTSIMFTLDPTSMALLPLPFEIFEEWRSVVDYKPFHCVVPWMNNPVFGAATAAFELVAKVSWICTRYPLDALDSITACELLLATYKIKLPKMTEKMRSALSEDNYLHLFESTVVAEIIVATCQLLLTKLLNPDLQQTDLLVQKRLHQIGELFKRLSPDSHEWVICGWPMLVVGVISLDPDTRLLIFDRCLRCADLYRTGFMNQVALILQKAWGSPQHPGTGWSVLFDRQKLKHICL